VRAGRRDAGLRTPRGTPGRGGEARPREMEQATPLATSLMGRRRTAVLRRRRGGATARCGPRLWLGPLSAEANDVLGRPAHRRRRGSDGDPEHVCAGRANAPGHAPSPTQRNRGSSPIANGDRGNRIERAQADSLARANSDERHEVSSERKAVGMKDTPAAVGRLRRGRAPGESGGIRSPRRLDNE
jgi:hypothetical protein